ncbi:MAG: beta-glucuronidase [Ruminococcaceae bacterium]|nr:beta-glucuronidase [Oscillospiraceae bacterium]
MTRFFDEHIKRSVQYLGGAWSFSKDYNNEGESGKWYLGLAESEKVTVPSVWNTEKDMLTYEGVAWYEKRFHSEGGCIRLFLGAVMTQAKVWLDGEYLGDHYGGFTQFDFIVKDVSKGMHTLTVRVDNGFDAHSIPQKQVDWYHYGGITRDVTVERLSGICALYNRIEYTLSDDLKTADCTAVVELFNAENESASTFLKITLGETEVYAGSVSLEAGERRELRLPVVINDVKLWSPEEPNLYDIRIETDTDDLYDRTGFRKIEVKDGKVMLNGEAMYVQGVNRHEEHPDFGMAFPQKLMKKDIDIALDMGCNTIRGSHYPNAPEFLDMLDERGMAFWSEIPIWGVGFSAETLGDETVLARGLEMHREMVRYYYNHPSIIIWGQHNEIPSGSQQAYEMSKLYYSFLKENGGNRIVTYACARPFEDICFDFCDLICINAYYGWYSGNISDWNKFAERFRARRKELGMEHKPVIMSEFGAAALYGHHTFDNIPWTEEYQAELITHCLKLFREDDMFVGALIWQFCNIRTCKEMGLNRARGFNNKGLLDEYRRPKAAYFAAKKIFSE